jgi:hypothetical protein
MNMKTNAAVRRSRVTSAALTRDDVAEALNRSTVAIAVLCAALTAGLGACATNPVTGERQLSLISESQEIQIGRRAPPQVEQSIGLVHEGSLQAYVNRIGTALAAETERPQLGWVSAAFCFRSISRSGRRSAPASICCS